MRYKIVSVRDRAIDTFGQPVFVNNIGGAIRSFGDEIKRPHTAERPNQFNQHPDDFDLYLMGEFDDETGEFVTDGPPRQIAVGKDYKAAV